MDTEGPAAAPVVEAPAEPMDVEIGAGEALESESRSAAATWPVCTCYYCTYDLDDEDHWEWIRQHDITVTETPPRDSARPDEWRARREALVRTMKEEGYFDDVFAAADYPAGGENQHSAPMQPSHTLGQVEFDERTDLMFKVDNPSPVASGRPPAIEIVTKEMLHFAWEAIKACASDRGKALSSAYGNFDKLVALGWLLGDVARGRLIDGGLAYRIGRKHGKRAPDIKSAFEAPLRKHGKRKYEGDEAREWGRVAAEQKEAELRSEPVDIDFEEPLLEAAAAPAAAASAASSSAMPPPPPRPPPPSQPLRRSERVELLKTLTVKVPPR